MRSSLVTAERSARLEVAAAAAVGPSATRLAADADSGAVFASPNSAVFAINHHACTGPVPPALDLADDNGLPLDIVGMHFIADAQALCIAIKSGTVMLAHSNSPSSTSFSHTENVGFIDGGILSMEWSPDSQLVVFVTGQDTLVEMTQDFDIVSESPIHTDSPGQAMPVSIGWGKKETQFHGTAGKQAAKASNILEAGANHLCPDDNLAPSITWRGDGQYFACSSIDRARTMRVLRVYNREGVLQTTCEFVDQIGHVLSWRPSGSLIASSQRLSQRQDIIFFEENGLRHGEFSLRDPSSHIVDLQWSCDSKALAILINNTKDSSDYSSAVQIWMSNNYHWYLKQEIRPSGKESTLSAILWDPLVPNRLHMIDGQHYRSVEYVMDVLASTSLSEKNPATIAVIDGDRLLVTPFRYKNVPPPMSYAQIQLSAPARHVAFSPDDAATDLAVLLADGSVQLWSDTNKKSSEIKEVGTIKLPLTSRSARQIIWLDDSTIMALEHDFECGTDVINAYSFNPKANPLEVSDTKSVALQNQHTSFVRIYYNASLNIAALQSTTGDIFEVIKTDGEWSAFRRETLPDVCPWMAAVELGPDASSKEVVWAGLNSRNKLFINQEVLSLECTSFLVHDEFFIATTLSHTAKFLPLSRSNKDFRFDSDDQTSGLTEQHRRVERGSMVIIAPPSDISLVLQMPRGNLETVYPRALVLSAVGRALKRFDYATAFITCRKHRIDMNLIIDYDPEEFKVHVADFLNQVNDPDHLNLFMSSIRNGSVIKTVYKSLDHPRAIEIPDKFNVMFDLLSRTLQSMDTQRYIQPILTIDARRQPPDLENAMRRILMIRSQGSAEDAEAALKYLVFLVDANKLYDAALGMYDFPLVLMVAQYSQKDPREYLSFLSELRKLPMFYQRFKIDDHLSRHASALRNLVDASHDHFEEALLYTKKHKLFKLAINLYSKGSKEHNAVMLEFAHFHSENDRHDEAALLYEMVGDFEHSLESYVRACAWREAISVARTIGLSDDNMQVAAEKLVTALLGKRDHVSASRILLDIVKSPERAVAVLIEGSLWSDAILTSNMHDLAHLKSAMIHPAAVKAAHDILVEIETTTTTFENQRFRLQQVRQEKQRKIAAGVNADDSQMGATNALIDDIDMLSDTSSMATSHVYSSGSTSHASVSTARTGKTAKQRRKLARRRAAGKEAAFEDEFLIKSLASAVDRFNALVTEIGALIRCLMGFGDTELAYKLQAAFRRLQTAISNGIPEIFVQTQPEQPPQTVDCQDDDPATNAVDATKMSMRYTPVLSTGKWWSDSLDA